MADTRTGRDQRALSHQRQVTRREPDALPVVRFGGLDWTAPALRYVAPGTAVYVLRQGPYAVQVFDTRHARSRRVDALCTARPAPAARAADPQQLNLND